MHVCCGMDVMTFQKRTALSPPPLAIIHPSDKFDIEIKIRINIHIKIEIKNKIMIEINLIIS